MEIGKTLLNYCTPWRSVKNQFEPDTSLPRKIGGVVLMVFGTCPFFPLCFLGNCLYDCSKGACLTSVRRIPPEPADQEALIDGESFETLDNVFGPKKWFKYFGHAIETPPLHAKLVDDLNGPCPVVPGKRMRDTHVVVWMPSTVVGVPLTINRIGAMMQTIVPGSNGNSAKYEFMGCKICSQIGQRPLQGGVWLAITKQIIDGSENMSFQRQEQMMQFFQGYSAPTAAEAILGVFMTYVSSGGRQERLLSRLPDCKFTRCKCMINGSHVIVGGFAPSGLLIGHRYNGPCEVGILAVRRYTYTHAINTPVIKERLATMAGGSFSAVLEDIVKFEVLLRLRTSISHIDGVPVQYLCRITSKNRDKMQMPLLTNEIRVLARALARLNVETRLAGVPMEEMDESEVVKKVPLASVLKKITDLIRSREAAHSQEVLPVISCS